MRESVLYYTGVGSRSARFHPKLMDKITAIAKRNSELGLMLRTGDACGADMAFTKGEPHPAIYTVDSFYALPEYIEREAYNMAESIHPAWHRCSDYAKRLHARNCLQVLGPDLETPSEFLICWTPQGQDVGGTRTAIVLARNNNIPVFNLYYGLTHLANFIREQNWYQPIER